MKEVLKDGQIYILRFDRGEEVLAGLISFARQSNIHAGTFSGIGAAERVTLSYYDFDKKEYLDTEIREVEVASLNGNLLTPHRNNSIELFLWGVGFGLRYNL